jgi:hypothetical protein
MRRILMVLVVTFVSTTLLAQRPSRRVPPSLGPAVSAERMVKEAMERLGEERKEYERDLKVLGHIRNSDKALVDAMQPTVALEKAHDGISEAERLNPDFFLGQAIIHARQEIENARRSPAAADFERLRALIRDALGISSRLVVRNALRMQEETMAWISVQELIATHLKTLADITGESLRASDIE